jgi:hypothetical protein
MCPRRRYMCEDLANNHPPYRTGVDVKSRWSFLAAPHWNGINAIIGVGAIAIAITATLITLRVSNPEVTTGVVKVLRLSATSVFPTELMPETDLSLLTLAFNNQPVKLNHLQLRIYEIQNLTGRHVAPQDFDSPITLEALGGNKILTVDVTPMGNRPPIAVKLLGDSGAVIPPVLLNAGESLPVKILISTPSDAPLAADPYAGDEGVIRWTAEIKGADLAIGGFPRPQDTWLNAYTPGLFVSHNAHAVVAIVFVALLLSWVQLMRMAISSATVKLTIFRTAEVVIRLGLAWATAEALVSFEDTALATYASANWYCIAAYAVALFFPLPKWLRRRPSNDKHTSPPKDPLET